MKKLILLLLLFNINMVYSQWESERKISLNENSAALNENMGKCIAVNGNIVHIVWSDCLDKDCGIYYKQSTDNGTVWGPDIRLNSKPSVSSFPSIAVNGQNIHVAYLDSANQQRTSNYLFSSDGGKTWSNPKIIGKFYWWPSVACSDSNVYFALNSNSTNNSEVWFRASSDNGKTWDSIIQISNAPKRSEDPAIAANGSFVHLAWNDNRTDTMQTFYRRSTDFGKSWEPEIQRTRTTVFAYCPALAVNGDEVDLIWGDRRSGVFEIFLLHSTDNGANWGNEKRLPTGVSGSVYPSIVRSGNHVHVIWMGNGLYYLHSSDKGLNWDSTVKLADNSSKPGFPHLAVSGSAVHVIWQDSRIGHPAVYYRRNPTGNSTVNNVYDERFSGEAEINQLSLTPNPLSDNSNLTFYLSEDCIISVKIFEIQGRELKSILKEEYRQKGDNCIPLKAGFLEQGIYYCRISTKNTIISRKFLIIK